MTIKLQKAINKYERCMCQSPAALCSAVTSETVRKRLLLAENESACSIRLLLWVGYSCHTGGCSFRPLTLACSILFLLYLFSFYLLYIKKLKNLATCTVRLIETCHSACISLLFCWIWLLICKSLWIKASAKWLNISGSYYFTALAIQFCILLFLRNYSCLIVYT